MGDPYEPLILEFVAERQRQGLVPKSYDPQTRIFVFGHGADGDVKVQLDNRGHRDRTSDTAHFSRHDLTARRDR
jgi:hypothetical protein